MRKIRIGNTFDILWAIYTGDGINEKPYNLEGKDLTMYLRDSTGAKKRVSDFTVNGHIISWRFEGKDQEKARVYSLVLIENEELDSMYTIDECDAFQLVANSSQVGCNCSDNDNLQVITLEFRSKMALGASSASGSSIAVDSELSRYSENPVQNKVITAALEGLEKSISEVSKQVNEVDGKVENLEENEIIWNDVE